VTVVVVVAGAGAVRPVPVTDAVFVSVVLHAAGEGSTVTVIVIVAVWPAFSVPTLQVTVVTPVEPVQVPTVEVADRKFRFAGSVSVTTTFWAAAAVAGLLTVTV
jgi:hypothetical protein